MTDNIIQFDRPIQSNKTKSEPEPTAQRVARIKASIAKINDLLKELNDIEKRKIDR